MREKRRGRKKKGREKILRMGEGGRSRGRKGVGYRREEGMVGGKGVSGREREREQEREGKRERGRGQRRIRKEGGEGDKMKESKRERERVKGRGR